MIKKYGVSEYTNVFNGPSAQCNPSWDRQVRLDDNKALVMRELKSLNGEKYIKLLASFV